MLRAVVLATAASALACSGSSPATQSVPSSPGASVATDPSGAPVATAPTGDERPPTLRLPRTFLPSASRVALVIDPAQPRFRGKVEIDGALSAPTPLVWLHARKLDIRSASARAGERTIALTAAPYGDDLLALRAAEPLPTGPLTLVLEYEGSQEERDTAGLFRQKAGDAWYSYTQFEATYARRAFPSFDEPDIKIPWQVTIDAPAGTLAVSNTSVAKEEALPDGGKRFRFAQTKMMPTYLVAFAVGPFDVVNAGRTPRGAPMRIIVPRGRARDAAYAAQVTPRIVAALESWFGTPYPYDKLDTLAIPVTVGFGAMENAGLITYKESRVLIDPRDSSQDRRYQYASTATHEIAHQWFGNLVTTAWWDDIWLNEGFATWMTDKIMASAFPQWGGLAAFDSRRGAMENDAALSARQVRQPIVTIHDIDTAFDAITYKKGATLLRMFERWVGPAVFQKGVRAYLAAHAWGNATSTDFAAAITAAAGVDVGPAFSSFLDRPGLPRIAFEVTCTAGQGARVVLHQSRFLPHGTGTTDEAAPWRLPVCVAFGRGAGRATQCTLVDSASAELTLPGKTCPAWVHPNADGAGYYRAGLTEAHLAALVDKGWARLNAAERLALFDDVVAMAERGDVPVTVALGLVPKVAQERSRYSMDALVNAVLQMEAYVPAGSEPGWRAWIVRTLGPRARAVGWKGRGGDLDVEIARTKLVTLVADAGEPKLRAEAIAMAASWRTLPAPLRKPVLSVSIDEPSVFASVMEAVVTETDRKVRTDLMEVLGYSRDPAHLRAGLALLLDSRIDPRDAPELYKPTAHRRAMRAVTEAFLRENMAALLTRMPRQRAAWQVSGITNVCDPARRDAIVSYVQQTFSALPGGPRRVAQAIEQMDQCIARTAMYEATLRAWLAPQRTGKDAVRPPAAPAKPKAKPAAAAKPISG